MDDGLDGAVRLSQNKEYLSGLVHSSKIVELYFTDYEQERLELLAEIQGIENEYSNETTDEA